MTVFFSRRSSIPYEYWKAKRPLFLESFLLRSLQYQYLGKQSRYVKSFFLLSFSLSFFFFSFYSKKGHIRQSLCYCWIHCPDQSWCEPIYSRFSSFQSCFFSYGLSLFSLSSRFPCVLGMMNLTHASIVKTAPILDRLNKVCFSLPFISPFFLISSLHYTSFFDSYFVCSWLSPSSLF